MKNLYRSNREVKNINRELQRSKKENNRERKIKRSSTRNLKDISTTSRTSYSTQMSHQRARKCLSGRFTVFCSEVLILRETNATETISESLNVLFCLQFISVYWSLCCRTSVKHQVQWTVVNQEYLNCSTSCATISVCFSVFFSLMSEKVREVLYNI